MLTVRPQRELAVALRLVSRWANGQGSPPASYVPIYGERRRPLFPGYVLVNCEPEQLQPIRQVADVSAVLGAATDDEIVAVRVIELAGGSPADAGQLTGGAMVVVKLFGTQFCGRVIEQRGSRVRILADVLSGAVVWVDRRHVKCVA